MFSLRCSRSLIKAAGCQLFEATPRLPSNPPSLTSFGDAPACRFDDFYELIYHNFALIPALASDSYYDRKFSSTLITSMVTGEWQ